LIQREKRYLEFIEFLVAFIDELNALAAEGTAVLVEGPRDRNALVDLGYTGKVLMRVSLSSTRADESLSGVRSVVVLTDMDKEGRKLAARYIGFFLPRGVKTLMSQRRRLKRASHGAFLHVENLSRFAPEVPEIRGLTEKMRL